MVLPDPVDALEQPVVRDEQRVRRSDPAALGDDRLVLDLGQVGHLERLELRGSSPPPLPASARRARPSSGSRSRRAAPNSSGAPPDLGLVGHRVGAHVHPPVQHPMIDPHRRRHGEDARVRLAQAHVRRVGRHEVEREHRLGEVHPVAKPPSRLLGLAPLLAEQGVVRVHRLPALAPLGRGNLERAE